MRRTLALAAPALALASAALISQPAQAKGIVLITSGESVAHYADLTGEMKTAAEQATGAEVRVGYKYEQFGVFWLELWTWGGSYVLYHDNTVWEMTPEETAQALGVKPEELGTPFLYKFPLGLLIVGGLVIGGIALSRMKGDEETPPAAT